MNINDVFIKYKVLYNFTNGLDDFRFTYGLKDIKKIKKYQALIDSGVDIDEFFYSNFALRKSFWVWNFLDNRSMYFYRNFNDIIDKNQKRYIKEILISLKQFEKVESILDFDNRDEFMRLFPLYSEWFWSVIYPNIKELVLSFDDSWVLENTDYSNVKELINKLTRLNLLVKRMVGYNKLKNRIDSVVNK